MRLFAHVYRGGSIGGFVVQPEGEVTAMLVPEAGAEMREIAEHDFEDTDLAALDLERLAKLRDDYTVELTPSPPRLVRRQGKTTS